MNHIYIIESDEGYRYIGSTTDIAKRLFQHQNHLAGWTKRETKSKSFWTKRGTKWALVYSEKFDTKTEALRREKWLKPGHGRDFLKKVLD